MSKNDDNILEIRIGTVGSVDQGKSSLISIIKYGILDNGNGSARNKVAKHPHEIKFGRTSDINSIFYKPSKYKNKSIAFIDLCGHRKYFKTTVSGLTSGLIDYCMLTVAANNGINRMGKQHLGIVLMLQLPLIIVISKIDICPEPIFKKTLKSILKILNKSGKKKCSLIIDNKQLQNIQIKFQNNPMKYCPIFIISNVTGENINLLRQFIHNLSKPKKNITKENVQKIYPKKNIPKENVLKKCPKKYHSPVQFIKIIPVNR